MIQLVLVNTSESTVLSTRLANVTSQFNVLAKYINNELRENPEGSLTSLVDDASNISLGRIQIIDSSFNIILDTYNINTGRICISQDVNKCFNDHTDRVFLDRDNQCIIGVLFITDGTNDHIMFATSSIADIYSAMSTIRVNASAITIILAILVIFAAYLASTLIVKPLSSINEVIEKIDKGHMSADINMKGTAEIEKISESFNVMLRKINSLEQSRQEFVSNVSHELKTPLASMKVLSDSILMSDDVPNEMYREFMENLSGEIDRENAIISDLLTLVKLDQSDSTLNIASTNINELLEKTLRLVSPLAREKNIEMLLESHRPVIADVDAVKLSMAVSNLVENAVKYNNNDGWVHVSLNADQTYFYIRVQDNGFGIPEAAQSQVFDRFYRVDKARDRAAGGTGLGLAITKSLVLAHNGEIKLYSEEGTGTTFSIQMPLTYTGHAQGTP